MLHTLAYIARAACGYLRPQHNLMSHHLRVRYN